MLGYEIARLLITAGDTVMFRSMKTNRPVPVPIRIALRGVDILPIPGHHTSLLKLPNLLRLTNELNQRLGRLARLAGSDTAADRPDVASS